MPFFTILKQFFYLIGFLLISWVLVHFVAVFGAFLAVALPVLHLVFYPNIVCFWCQLKGNSINHRLSHSLIDSFLFLIATILSIGVVYLESRLLFTIGFPGTERSVSFIIPSKGQYRLKEIFPMKIEITGIKTSVNAIQADLSFDPTAIEVVDITTEGSFASIFLQKEFSNELGYARLTGGLPNPGYNQPSGVFGTIYLRGKRPGLTELKFLNSSLVLANDGRGTNVLKDLPSASYLILPESISEEEESAQKDIIIRKQVLGDASVSTSLEFYQYTSELPKPYSGILGTSTPAKDSTTSTTERRGFMEILSAIDSAIIEFWQKIASIFSN